MKLAVWCPMPPSPSGIADYAAEQLPFLSERFEVAVVAEAPAARPEADVDLYQLGNSPAHGFVYRAALERPGVLLLHEWSLHHLVLSLTVEQGDAASYLRQMRRVYGERGSFLGRQVARALGGPLWPALYPLCERILQASLAVVALTRFVAERARPRVAPRPVLHLPHHLSLPLEPLPERRDARRELGLPVAAPIVTAPGLATVSKRLDVALRAVVRLRRRFPDLRLCVAGGVEPGLPLEAWAASDPAALVVTGRLDLDAFLRHLVAADLVLALRFPTHGEISGALVRSLGAGRAALVTAGTPAAEEFPEGLVVPIDPDRGEEEELVALIGTLLEDAALRERIGGRARAHVLRHHGLRDATTRLADFLVEVASRREELAALVRLEPEAEAGLYAQLLDEVRFAAQDLGLAQLPGGIEDDLRSLAP
ncbi:MAG TPA: glycosyltransferase [Vicinamibacteria bacterium]|nr:glycosyltransferase [Vicinamibacteria bacterium]